MIETLLDTQYKDGSTIPDEYVARILIALLIAGQHNTAASRAWVILELAHQPHLIEELYQEQRAIVRDKPLTLELMKELTLQGHVVKETLRLHSPIHSIIRQVKNPMVIPEKGWVVPPSYTLIAAPGVLARSEEYFQRPIEWEPHR
jgi:sterol 14alpha-demethylase